MAKDLDRYQNQSQEESVCHESKSKTGGGPMVEIKISDLDDRIIKILSEEAIFGIDDEDASLESEGVRRETISWNVAGPSGFQESVKRKAPGSSWVQNAEFLEGTDKRRRMESDSSASPFIPDIIMDDDEEDKPILTPRRGRASVAAIAAKEIKQQQSETNLKIDGFVSEITKLNKNFETLLQQNQESMNNRVATNNILERIARALEGQYL